MFGDCSQSKKFSEESPSDYPPIPTPKPFGPPLPTITRLDRIEERPLSWLWDGVVPLGKLTLIAGDPGVGKSLVTLDLAARVSRGGPFPGRCRATPHQEMARITSKQIEPKRPSWITA